MSGTIGAGMTGKPTRYFCPRVGGGVTSEKAKAEAKKAKAKAHAHAHARADEGEADAVYQSDSDFDFDFDFHSESESEPDELVICDRDDDDDDDDDATTTIAAKILSSLGGDGRSARDKGVAVATPLPPNPHTAAVIATITTASATIATDTPYFGGHASAVGDTALEVCTPAVLAMPKRKYLEAIAHLSEKEKVRAGHLRERARWTRSSVTFRKKQGQRSKTPNKPILEEATPEIIQWAYDIKAATSELAREILIVKMCASTRVLDLPTSELTRVKGLAGMSEAECKLVASQRRKYLRTLYIKRVNEGITVNEGIKRPKKD